MADGINGAVTPEAIGAVSAPGNIADNSIVRGDGGGKVVQDSAPTISDAGDIDLGAAGLEDDNTSSPIVVSDAGNPSFNTTAKTITGAVNENTAAIASSGIAWNDNRTAGTGVGLTHTIGASAASGVQSFKTVLDNTQSNALTVNEISLGASAVGHKGLKITAAGASSAQRGIQVDMINGTGRGVESIANGAGDAFSASLTSTGATARNGFEAVGNNSCRYGTFFRATSTANSNSDAVKAFVVDFASSSNVLARTTNICEVFDARSKGGAQTYTDNFDLISFKRTSIVTGSNLTSQGSVVKIENVATGAFASEAVIPLEIIQSAQSTGAPIDITQNAVVSTNFKKVFVAAGYTLWVSDGTTPDGNLSGTIGDECKNGPSGQPFYCTGTTNWTGM